MASSSSLSLPLSSLSRTWEHHVFPSFHGPDVRKKFLSHLRKEFKSKVINMFVDNEIKRGEFIGPELKRAIRGSKIAIVLLSKNYASSSWCLEELVEIMKKQPGQTVITIFYEVEPTDVKKQTGDFGKAFEETCKGKGEEKVQTWREALKGVATIAGYDSSKWEDETDMIEKIAKDILSNLNHLIPSHDFDRSIGLEAHMERMEPLLRLDLDEVRMIGIWGQAGIGKTTIARFLFKQFSNRFQDTALMLDIQGSYPKINVKYDESGAQLRLQEKMLSLMTNDKDITISDLGAAKARLRERKVLLVLDDVDQLAQLDALAEDVQWFGPGSRIIITTRDRQLLTAHNINHIYKVNLPSTDEAFQMFRMYAFHKNSPKDGFDVLAREITSLLGELPLGLKVMGSYFKGLSKESWSTEISRLKTKLNKDIRSILKFSYDGLFDEDKDLFLHIACFFNNYTIDTVEEVLAERFEDFRHSLTILEEKSLISIDNDIYGYLQYINMHSLQFINIHKFQYINMHNLLAQLGKEIARESVREPRQPQFWIDYKDISEGLTINTRSVIGISIDSKYELDVTKKSIEGMSDLEFLRVSSDPNIISSQGPLTFISPKLRLLEWSNCPLTCLHFTNDIEFLVNLQMGGSNLEKLWDGTKLLRNLKRMNLAYSTNLKELPDLSMATNLKELNIRGCLSLVDFPSSIGNLTSLKKLDYGCLSLVELPFSIGNATSLKKLDLGGCSSLVKLPFSIGNLTNLTKLDFYGCSSLVELPFSIGNLTNLQKLVLKRCSSLVDLPSSIGNLTNLTKLDFDGCSSLVELPFSIGNISNLQNLDLNSSSLVDLPSSIGNLSNLTELNFDRCSSLVELPSSIGNATNLEKLVFYDCSGLWELPSSIGNLTNLSTLSLMGCSSLVELPSTIGNLTNLRQLDLFGCSSIMELPSSIGNLTNLTVLDLSDCSSLVELHSSIGNATNLEELVLYECSGLWELPSSIGNLTNLRELVLTGCSVELPSSIGNATNLQGLYLIECSSLMELPSSIGNLTNLSELILRGCSSLVSLPQLPDSLKCLDAEDCESLEKLDFPFCNPGICLNFAHCYNLNKEARDLIIQTSTLESIVLPGEEVPACFTFKASGSSVTVKLNQKPLRTSTKFKACILVVNKDKSDIYGLEDKMSVSCSITSNQNALIARRSYVRNLYPIITEHLYIFDFEAEEVTSTELVFTFEFSETWEIKECGILSTQELHADEVMRASEVTTKCSMKRKYREI